MKISHPAITSSVFELIKTLELDVQLGANSWSIRIELFKDTETKSRFRCHVWELELFRLTPTFPEGRDNQPAHTSDDVLMVDRGIPRSRISYPKEDIVAPDAEAALEIVLDDLKRFLEYVTQEEVT